MVIASTKIQPLLDQEFAAAFLKRFFPQRRLDRVLLVAPPDADSEMFQFATAKRGRYTNYPPYGLAVLAQNLRAVGVEARICNLNHEILKRCAESESELTFDFDALWRRRLDREIEVFAPDLIGVTCMFTMTHNSLKKVCEQAAMTGTPVAIGGVHVTNDVESVLDDIPCARVAFLREGDRAVRNFVGLVRDELDVEALGQVILSDGEHRCRFQAACQPTEEEIDVIPAHDLVELDELSKYGTIGSFYCFKPKDTRFATTLSNRGCRAQCTFCSVRNFNGKRVRQRSVDSTLDELQMLEECYGISHIMWLDDDLLKDHGRAISLFNGMVRRDLNLTWDASNGVISASCTNEVIHAAAESGCIALNIGMESGNPEILRQIRKPGTVKNFLKAAETLRKYEQIHASVFLMVGFPGETMRMIMDTINVSQAMKLDWYRITPLQPLPNTPIYDSMVEQGLIKDVDRKEVRYLIGGYGKQPEVELDSHLASADVEKSFLGIPLDDVPTPNQIAEIWFYMNYHLNFRRLFTERRPDKLREQIQILQALCDIISPEHGFALYFMGYLQYKLYGWIDSNIIDRLVNRLESSIYWNNNFKAFGLSADDLVTADFEGKEVHWRISA